MTLSSGNSKAVPILPPPLTETVLCQFVRKAVKKDWIREGFHAEVERAGRNVSFDDILCGLERLDWKLIGHRRAPRFRDSPYTYEILTKDIDDDDLTLVIAPNLKDGTLKVITKY